MLEEEGSKYMSLLITIFLEGVEEAHLEILRPYFCLFAQGIILMLLKETYVVLGSNTGRLHAKHVPYPLYYVALAL